MAESNGEFAEKVQQRASRFGLVAIQLPCIIVTLYQTISKHEFKRSTRQPLALVEDTLRVALP
jgi:hypothetical protein